MPPLTYARIAAVMSNTYPGSIPVATMTSSGRSWKKNRLSAGPPVTPTVQLTASTWRLLAPTPCPPAPVKFRRTTYIRPDPCEIRYPTMVLSEARIRRLTFEIASIAVMSGAPTSAEYHDSLKPHDRPEIGEDPLNSHVHF